MVLLVRCFCLLPVVAVAVVAVAAVAELPFALIPEVAVAAEPVLCQSIQSS